MMILWSWFKLVAVVLCAFFALVGGVGVGLWHLGVVSEANVSKEACERLADSSTHLLLIAWVAWLSLRIDGIDERIGRGRS